MPIKGLSEQRRLPREGKIHLGVKVVQEGKEPYPKAVDYFVLPEGEAPGSQHHDELVRAFGEKPKELRIVLPLEDEEAIASQYYRCYTRTRGLVCRGDGELCARMVDLKTGDIPDKDTVGTEMKEMSCQGRECPDYKAGKCREMMHLQFMLPEISGLGVWQIDTSSINSIRNINSNLSLLKAIYGRISMVPLILSLQKIEVTPPGVKKKSVYVLDIHHTDSMIAALIKAKKPPMELLMGPPDAEQAERDIADLWPESEQEVMLSEEEAAERMTPKEIAQAEPVADTVKRLGIGELVEGEVIEPHANKSPAGLDMDWVAEKIKILQGNKLKAWTDASLLSYMKTSYKVEADTVMDAAAKLDQSKAMHFARKIQETLDASGL